jgi:hypothetical protein
MSLLGELSFFLGLHICQSNQGIFISQTKYIREMLKRFGMEDCKPVITPMQTSCKLRKDCNVPTLGHHHMAEIYDDQSSQMGARVSTGIFERHFGVHPALMIIFHHYERFRTGWLWFRCILTISMILTILSYKSMEFTEEVILGTFLGGTSQCNSSLESGGAALHDGMARSDFQWPGKPQGEIRSFSKVKRLIN